MMLFGVAYGAASMGCTLPLFLTLVATSLGGAKLGAFIAYGIGMAAVLMALSIGIALVRAGAVNAVRGGLRYVAVIANLLLIVSGCYLAYYWARVNQGDTETLADDPIVSSGIRFSGHIRVLARDHGTGIVLAAGIIVLPSRQCPRSVCGVVRPPPTAPPRHEPYRPHPAPILLAGLLAACGDSGSSSNAAAAAGATLGTRDHRYQQHLAVARPVQSAPRPATADRADVRPA